MTSLTDIASDIAQQLVKKTSASPQQMINTGGPGMTMKPPPLIVPAEKQEALKHVPGIVAPEHSELTATLQAAAAARAKKEQQENEELMMTMT